MAHWVFRIEDGSYVGTRKAPRYSYDARVTKASSLDDARVFNSAQAATNSGRQGGFKGRAVQLDRINHL